MLERDKAVLKVTLNRSRQANAVNKGMMAELAELLNWLRYEPEIHYLVITGQGKFFSVGADLVEVVQDIDNLMTNQQVMTYQADANDLMRKLENLEQITICAINGYMIGGGLAIAMACDFRVMDARATLSIPEAQLGMVFTWGSIPRLIKLVGAAKAKELIMLCNEIGAEEALRIGLVNLVAPAGDLFTVVDEILNKLRQSPFLPLRLTKKIVNSIDTIHDVKLFEPEFYDHSFLTGIPQELMREMVNRRLKK